MPPYQGGGDMIALGHLREDAPTTTLPYKFEAGTPNIAGAVGLGAAIDYLAALGLERDRARTRTALLAYADGARSQRVPGVRIIGTARARRRASLSFVMDGVHPHDIGTILDREGVAIRTGHHCAQPVMDRFGVPATARASFAFYNTREDVDALVAAAWPRASASGVSRGSLFVSDGQQES